MVDKLFDKEMMALVKDHAIKNYRELAPTPRDAENYLARIYAHSVISALTTSNYKVTIERGDEKIVFERGKA